MVDEEDEGIEWPTKRALKEVVKSASDMTHEKPAWPVYWEVAKPFIAQVAKEAAQQATTRGSRKVTAEDVKNAIQYVGAEGPKARLEPYSPENDTTVILEGEELDLVKKTDYTRYLALKLAEANRRLIKAKEEPVLLASAKEVTDRRNAEEKKKRGK